MTRLPIADCASQLECAACLENASPLCGWCVLENKCSRKDECFNFQHLDRWLQAGSSASANQCPSILNTFPEHFNVDDPQMVAFIIYSIIVQYTLIICSLLHPNFKQLVVTVSRSLPLLRNNQTYICFFEVAESTFRTNFTIEAKSNGLAYTCNISASNLSTVLNGFSTGY